MDPNLEVYYICDSQVLGSMARLLCWALLSRERLLPVLSDHFVYPSGLVLAEFVTIYLCVFYFSSRIPSSFLVFELDVI